MSLDIREPSPRADSSADVPSTTPQAFSPGPWIWAGLTSLFLLAAACWPMQQHTLPIWARLCLACGAGIWLLVLWRTGGPREALEQLDRPAEFSRRLWIGLPLTLALTVLAWRQNRGGVLTAGGVSCWLSAILAWFIAWWPVRRKDAPRPAPRDAMGRLGIAIALLAILGIGGLFRFHRLAEIPPQPGSDQVEDLLNVVDLENGERPAFFPRNTGQPPLPFYWEFFLHRVAGLPINYLFLKISTALIGMLAIPAMYWLGAELGGPAFGLISAALCAWSKWPTLGARRGLTFAWAVFPAALALWAVLRYMRRGDRRSALWAGFWIGLGQFGYNAFKIVPGLVPLAVLLCLFDSRWKGRRWRLIGGGALITATALLVFLPLLQYMLERPQDFWYRAMTRVGTKERALPGPAPVVFASNLKNMALAFHWRGDNAWINSVSEEPFLDPVTGALLLAGASTAIVCALRGSRRWTLIFLSLFLLTLASTLALAFPVENPAINRAAVALPSVLVLAALPVAWIWEESRRRNLAERLGVTAAFLVLAAASVKENFESYFVRFEHQNTVILEPVLDMVRVLKEYGTRGVPARNVYLFNRNYWVDGRCINFEIGDLSWSDAHDVAPSRPVPFIRDRPLLFFFHANDPERRQQLKDLFPEGEEKLIETKFADRNYYTYFVPRPGAPRPAS